MPGCPVLHHLLEFAKLMSIESVMLPNRLILCRPILLTVTVVFDAQHKDSIHMPIRKMITTVNPVNISHQTVTIFLQQVKKEVGNL